MYFILKSHDRMWGACQRVQLDDGADSSLHRNQRGSRSRRLQLRQWLGPVNRTWRSGTELPARPEDFNRDSSWSRFHKARFLVRLHHGFQLLLQVRVARSPEHGRDHLHPLHGWIPAVRGVGKVSPLVSTCFESFTCTGCARAWVRTARHTRVHSKFFRFTWSARPTGVLSNFRMDSGRFGFVNGFAFAGVFIGFYFLLKPEDSPPASSKDYWLKVSLFGNRKLLESDIKGLIMTAQSDFKSFPSHLWRARQNRPSVCGICEGGQTKREQSCSLAFWLQKNPLWFISQSDR